MPVPIAELFISVSADVSAAISGLNGLETRLGSTTQAFRDATPAALLFAGAGAAIGAGFVSSIKTAADFEHQMSGVRAVMSTDDIKQFGSALDALALKLGADTAFTAREAAAGIEELIKAGVPAQAVLEGAGAAALNLAAATGTDVATAATIAAQAMNAFKVPVSELPTLVDRLAGVVNVSAADMSDLRFGLQAAGAVAATVGLSFTDTAAAIGIFANNGLRGQDAGTSLKTMLINLVPNTKAQTNAFKNLGLITADGANAFFDARGKVKSLADISGVLQSALKGMTDQQKLAALQVLFGTDAMRAAAILARTGADGVNQFTAAVQQVSAADQAAERLNNLLGRLEQLGGSFQTVQIIIGRFFLPTISAIADHVKEVLNAFSSLSPAAQGVITAIVGITGAAASLIGGFVLLGPAMRLLAPSFGALITLLPRILAIFGPIGIAAGILASDFLGIRTSLAKTFSGAATILGNFGLVFDKAVNGDVSGALGTLQAILGALVPGLGPILVGIRGALSSAFTEFGPILSNFGLVVQKIFSGDVAGAFDTFRAIIGALSPPLGQFADVLGRIGGAIGAGVGAFFENVLPTIVAAIGGFAADASAGFQAFFTEVLPAVADAAGRFAGDAGAGLTTFFTVTMPPILSALGTFTGDAAAGFVTFFREHLPAVAEGLDRFTANPGAAFVAFFRDDLPVVIATAQQWTADTTAGLVDFFQNKAPIIIAGMTGFSPQATQNFLAFFTSFDNVKAQLESLQPLFASLGAFFTAFANFQAAIANLEQRAAGKLFGELGGVIQSFAVLVGPAAAPVAQIGNTFALLGTQLAGVTGVFNAASDALERLAKAILDIPFDKLPSLHDILNLLVPGAGLLPIPTAPGAAGGTQSGAAFNPNAATGGPLVSIGQLIISSEAEAEAFLARMAAAIAGATGRVTAPPDNSGNPALSFS